MNRGYLIAGALLCVLLGTVGGFIAGAESVRARAAQHSIENQSLKQTNADLEHDLGVVRELATRLGREMGLKHLDSEKVHRDYEQTIADLKTRLDESQQQLKQLSSELAIAKRGVASPAASELTNSAARRSSSGNFTHHNSVIHKWNQQRRRWEVSGEMENATGTAWKVAYFGVAIIDPQGEVVAEGDFMLTHINNGERQSFNCDAIPLDPRVSGVGAKAAVAFQIRNSIIGE